MQERRDTEIENFPNEDHFQTFGDVSIVSRAWGEQPSVEGVTDTVLVVEGRRLHVNKVETQRFDLPEVVSTGLSDQPLDVLPHTLSRR